MHRTMPRVNLGLCQTKLAEMSYTFTNPCNGEITTVKALDAAKAIVARQGANAGCLRASKPQMVERIIERERHGYTGKYRDSSLVDSAAAQVWRYVAFEASPIGQHHCLPVMASYDAPFDMPVEELNAFSKWCQAVADVILETMPQKPGLERWGRALGYL